MFEHSMYDRLLFELFITYSLFSSQYAKRADVSSVTQTEADACTQSSNKKELTNDRPSGEILRRHLRKWESQYPVRDAAERQNGAEGGRVSGRDAGRKEPAEPQTASGAS